MVEERADNPVPKPLRILIADDSAAIRASLSALISRVPGVEIVGLAKTGLEAIELIRELKPDLATLDIRMPEMTGINVLEAIKQERLNIIVIVMTNLAENEYRRICLDLGACHFFHKSSEFERVIEVLNDCVRHLKSQG